MELLEAVGLTDAVSGEHPDLDSVVSGGVVSWKLPTGWIFMARCAPDHEVAVSNGNLPAAWLPVGRSEALACLGWFLRRRGPAS